MPETAERPIRIVLVDDHALFRESVVRLLSAESAFQIVGDCSTSAEACRLLRNHPVDLVLLDFDLGDRDCTDFVRSAAEAGFHGRVLLVTAGVPEAQGADLIRCGISGIFMKHDSPALLSQAIREVMDGKVWFSQKFLQRTLTTAGLPHPTQTDVQLTERERQVLSHVFEGLTNKEIADRLAVSESSVKATLQQLFSKTGVRTRSQLVRVALEQYKELL
jgi:DNA-binding NarL/FixJ family response regulator